MLLYIRIQMEMKEKKMYMFQQLKNGFSFIIVSDDVKKQISSNGTLKRIE